MLKKSNYTYISIHLSEQNMWIAMWYGFASSKLALDVKNRSILKSNDKFRSIDQERPANTNSSFVTFLRMDKDCDPREYGKSNKTLPSTRSLPSYLVNNASKSFSVEWTLEMSTLQQNIYYWNWTESTKLNVKKEKTIW